jgi:XTP/dITP diphosphohydrolase
MSWPAWQAVVSADRVLGSDDASPLFRAVTGAGHRVDVLASPSARDLLAAARQESVVWLATDEEATTLATELAEQVVAPPEDGAELPEIEVLHASYDLPGARLLDLVTVMDRLRTECPWDREQTHRSLARYLLEEAYETLEAIDNGDREHLREELGDLLLQVYFHSRIAEEDAEEPFSIDDVAGDIVDKLVHRHPHVFAGLDVAGVDEVEANWETLKAKEKARASVLEGIPAALPALALAEKVLGRAGRLGVTPPPPGPGAGVGERLLALVVEAREAGADAEQELRDAVRRLADGVRAAERG